MDHKSTFNRLCVDDTFGGHRVSFEGSRVVDGRAHSSPPEMVDLWCTAHTRLYLFAPGEQDGRSPRARSAFSWTGASNVAIFGVTY